MIRADQVDLLIQAHVAGIGLSGAAEHAAMSRTSAWRYLKRPDVQERIASERAQRRSSMVEYIAQIRSLADLVTDAMVGILDDEPSHTTIIRIAAVVLPEVRHLSLVDLYERIERLEQKAAA